MSIFISQWVIDQVSASSATILIDGSPATANQRINTGMLVEIVVNEGFKLEDEPYLFEVDDWAGGTAYFYLPIVEDRLASAIYNNEFSGYSGNANISILTVVDAGDSSAPINNVYVVDSDIVAAVNAERFSYSFGADEDSFSDYGIFISSLVELPFIVDPALIAGGNTIKLGDISLVTTADQLNTDIISLDLGEITIPETHNNLIDFSNIIVNLHLPYSSPISIDVRQIVGETISIEYLVSVYSGEATINLRSTKVDGAVFHSTTVKMGIDVPYSSTDQTPQVENATLNKLGNNGVTIPFVELVKNDFVLPNGFFTIPIIDEGQLSGEVGYITVDNVELEVEALSNEKELIISRLASGVIIK